MSHPSGFPSKALKNSLFVLDWHTLVLGPLRYAPDQGELTGQPAQVQLEPQPQEPEEAHPQPDMMMVVLKVGVEDCVYVCLRVSL